MSRSHNKVTLIGRLGRDPDMRFTGSGTPFCRLRLATEETDKDSNGEPTHNTEWHSLIAWGKLAEIINQYFKKGDTAFFEGKLQTRSFEDNRGEMRYVTEVKIADVILLPQVREAEEATTQAKA